jgi:HAD superfamily hydrolase (TIGR01509 family)
LIEAIIFDLDGLLSDTETLHMLAYQEALRQCGVLVSDEEYARHWIRDGLGITEFAAQRGLDLDPADVRKLKAVAYDRLLNTSLQPMPGACELVQRLQGRTRLALASSSYRANIARVVQGLGLSGCFEAIAGSEDVLFRVKPAPDVFLHVAQRLGLPPSACLVLDDAEKGIVAATRAGMQSIAVPNRYTRDNDFSSATWVVGSLLKAGQIIDTLIAAHDAVQDAC